MPHSWPSDGYQVSTFCGTKLVPFGYQVSTLSCGTKLVPFQEITPLCKNKKSAILDKKNNIYNNYTTVQK